MKKLIYTSALFFIASTAISLAGENKMSLPQIKKNISSHISVPENLRKTNFNEYVLISVTTCDDGKLKVNEICSANEDLKEHVMQQIAKMHLKGQVLPGQVFNLKLEFKVI